MSDLQDEIARTLDELPPCEHSESAVACAPCEAAVVMPLFEREARRREAAAFDHGIRESADGVHSYNGNPYRETP